MASVDLDNLTDSEIRSKLIEFGQTVGPVTATTRKLYLKKLKSLLDQNQSSVDLNTSGKYDPRQISHSSGEDSDEPSSRSQRKSMPPPRINKSPKRKSPTRASLSNLPIANSTFAEPKTSTKQTYETYNTGSTHTNVEIRRSTRSSLGVDNSTSSQGIYGDNDVDYNAPLSRLTKPVLSQPSSDVYKVTSSPTKLTSPDLGTGLSDAFKSRLQASGSTSFQSSYTSPRLNSSNQPYASEYVRKLSASRSVSGFGSANTSSISSKLLDVKESDDEDSGSPHVYTRFTQGGRSTASAPGRGKRSSPFSDSWLPFDSPVSAALLLMFSLFFLVIGITYVNMHSSDTSVSTSSELYYPICTQDSQTPNVNCFREVDKEIVSTLFKIIYNVLYERLNNRPCSEATEGPFGMSDYELQKAILDHDHTMGTWITQHHLPLVKILITANPKLKLGDISGGIAILNPPVPTICKITNNVLFAVNWIVKGLLVLGTFGAIYVGVRYYMMREASHKEEVYKLANSIIEIISSKGPDSYVPMIHVRDQLIPVQDRARLEKLWSDAVNILNCDSRVRCEQQLVEGEECLVWRWVASSYNSNKRKTWQGQAFDTMEGSVNSLPNSPTSCLKIRHMFDAALEEGDDWVNTVVDAILEKTKDARILHIAVERQSREGCVYMKCASPADAGIAYRALHGSWFDSKLVTVKYIREARYLERFPESAKCTQPLFPSKQSHNYFT